MYICMEDTHAYIHIYLILCWYVAFVQHRYNSSFTTLHALWWYSYFPLKSLLNLMSSSSKYTSRYRCVMSSPSKLDPSHVNILIRVPRWSEITSPEAKQYINKQILLIFNYEHFFYHICSLFFLIFQKSRAIFTCQPWGWGLPSPLLIRNITGAPEGALL